MENLRNRFPTLIPMILENVDDESLVNFKESNREMHDFIVKERCYWIRILRKYRGNFVEFSKSWKMVIEKNPVAIVREIAVSVEEFFNFQMPVGRYGIPNLSTKFIPRNTRQWAPLHIAAERGNLSLFQYIFLKTKNEYPISSKDPITGLRLAVQHGHLEVCQYIVNNISVDRNVTTDLYGRSPIHFAVVMGQLEVCKLLIENMQDKIPQTNIGRTPLHLAAKHGHLEISKLLIVYMENKNPMDNQGWTPLHLAAKYGHGELCKLIAGYIDEKNPVSNDGFTPHQLMMQFSSDLFLNSN